MGREWFKYKFLERKVILRLRRSVCETPEELLGSDLFLEVIRHGLQNLEQRDSPLLGLFQTRPAPEAEIQLFVQTLQFLVKMPADLLPNVVPGAERFFRHRSMFNELIEYFYNYWRNFDRFVLCDSEGDVLDKRPYRTFNQTIETLMHLVRQVYRDLQENLTGSHPRIYRQVRAGAEIAAISFPLEIPFPDASYGRLNGIPVIRQILLYPPLVLNPPMNKRTGRFERIFSNPLEQVEINKDEWLCYPAKVGPFVILVYFHEKFFELGFSLCNLFELAGDEDLTRRPDAVYLFGVPGGGLDSYGAFPTVFYDDEPAGMLVGAVPNRDEFGYFGYLKKMVLTLHNIKMIKAGRLPFHGALVRLSLRSGQTVSVLIAGDTGAGKSETLESLRAQGGAQIRELITVADDMGSLALNAQDRLVGYGTEIGAFLRLDDLQPGYAFGQIDRSIIMSPNQVNARVILLVTTFEHVIHGYPVDYILYANNYDEVNDEYPLIERFSDARQALKVFKEGTVMSKGTTTASGLVHTYFANVFGPAQYREAHDALAVRFFDAYFAQKIYVGQIRTRLGIPGWEQKGPEAAARALLELVATSPESSPG